MAQRRTPRALRSLTVDPTPTRANCRPVLHCMLLDSVRYVEGKQKAPHRAHVLHSRFIIDLEGAPKFRPSSHKNSRQHFDASKHFSPIRTRRHVEATGSQEHQHEDNVLQRQAHSPHSSHLVASKTMGCTGGRQGLGFSFSHDPKAKFDPETRTQQNVFKC